MDSDQLSIDWLQGTPDLEMMLEFMDPNAAKYVNCLHASVP